MDVVEAIQLHVNAFTKLIQGSIVSVCNDLKSQGLLGEEDYDGIVNGKNPPCERANDLIQLVITRVKVEALQYQVFYSILWDKHKNLHIWLKKLPESHCESVLHCMS